MNLLKDVGHAKLADSNGSCPKPFFGLGHFYSMPSSFKSLVSLSVGLTTLPYKSRI